METYIGIDPGGSSGAIAIIGVGTNSDTIVHLNHVEFSKTTLKEWYDFLIGCHGIRRAVVEDVHSMPGQGVSSSMKFGVNVGQIQMALTAAKIPFEKVTPQKWMKFYGMKKDKNETKTEWKRRLRERLQQLIPSLKVTNNNADAYLIAYYNWKQQTQKPTAHEGSHIK